MTLLGYVLLIGAAIGSVFLFVAWCDRQERGAALPPDSRPPIHPLEDKDTLDRRIAGVKAEETVLCAECPIHNAIHDLERQEYIMKNITVDFYIDRSGQHRWRIVSSNGSIIADCGEGYKTKRSAKGGLMALVKRIATGKFIVK